MLQSILFDPISYGGSGNCCDKNCLMHPTPTVPAGINLFGMFSKHFIFKTSKKCCRNRIGKEEEGQNRLLYEGL